MQFTFQAPGTPGSEFKETIIAPSKFGSDINYAVPVVVCYRSYVLILFELKTAFALTELSGPLIQIL